ncbi:MAG TPA: hypothetical protein VGV57_09735 [Thermoleophilaceae bacterium]|nr:hypothetical protein [Thermoleophilaceae bacterium]
MFTAHVEAHGLSVCNVHHHHAYWRFDFDVVSPAHNAVREVQ